MSNNNNYTIFNQNAVSFTKINWVLSSNLILNMKAFTIDGFDFRLGDLFSEEFVKQIKEQFQVQDGVRLSIKTSKNKVEILCKNSDVCGCRYSSSFIREVRSSGYIVCQLIQINKNHSQYCYDDVEANFLRDLGYLRKLHNSFAVIIQGRLVDGKKVGNPTEMMPIIAQQLGESPTHFQDILEKYNKKHPREGFYRQSLKKKIDNTISEIKSNLPLHIKKMYSQQQLNKLLARQIPQKIKIKKSSIFKQENSGKSYHSQFVSGQQTMKKQSHQYKKSQQKNNICSTAKRSKIQYH